MEAKLHLAHGPVSTTNSRQASTETHVLVSSEIKTLYIRVVTELHAHMTFLELYN